MVTREYIPEAGNIVWLDFGPSQGHEQQGVRPGIVVSNSSFNIKTGISLVCPITKQDKGYIFTVTLKKGLKTSGVILVNHIKSIDWRTRKVQFIEKTEQQTLEDVQSLIKAILSGEHAS